MAKGDLEALMALAAFDCDEERIISLSLDELRRIIEDPDIDDQAGYISHRLHSETAGGAQEHCSLCGEAVPARTPHSAASARLTDK